MKQRLLWLGLASIALGASIAMACNVPVFRYALERWPPDLYEIVVIHDGGLSAADAQQIDSLQDSDHLSSKGTNFRVRSADAKQLKDKTLLSLWDNRKQRDRPLMVMMYPRKAREVPDRIVTTAAFSSSAIETMVDSPVRQKLAKQLLDGDSAVWVFVPCGDKEQDEAARKMLELQMKRNQEELKLPPQDEIEADEFFVDDNPIELRLSFSMVTLNREDSKERFLLNMLLGSEPDLEALNQPMAFPVIGRGRVLYALVGKGIYSDTIEMASKFVVGPCSCQVKDQNPGFDLLMAVDWDKKMGGEKLSREASGQQSKPILIEIPPGK
ncbi:MAG: hypothetical protein AAGI63_19315 [Planctomycetota bacterium]